MNQFDSTRQFYERHMPDILAAPRNDWAIECYSWESHIATMTPIEAWLWGDIREANMVMYPQFPVDRFFVDFANPVARVAIECDGYAFHRDKQKDAARDARLRDIGWTIYRITGADCRTDFNEETMQGGYARRFVEFIAERHRLRRKGFEPMKQMNFELLAKLLQRQI